MSNKEVADAEAVIARIKQKPTEDELIEEQKKREPEDEDEPEEHAWMHTHDGGGSFVITGKGSGLFPHEVTLTRFTPLKVRR
jgi:hypothetical protein